MADRLNRTYSRALVGLVGAARRSGIHRKPVVGTVVRRMADPVLRRARPSKVYVNGFEFELDANDDLDLVAHGNYEPVMQEVLRRHLRPGARYVDGGAHIGFHALAAARIVGSTGSVVAFEPHPTTYRLLAGNIARNGMDDRVRTVNAALSDTTGDAVLHLSSETSGDHRVLHPGDEARDTVPIKTFRLDDALDDDQPVDFLKLDVQGAELAVLRGMPRVLERSPNLVAVLEFAPFVMPPDLDPAELLACVRDAFDDVHDVDELTGHIEERPDEHFLRAYTRENERFTNLLCVRRRG